MGFKATIEHGQGEYLVNAPDGFRFANLECHQLVLEYAEDGIPRRQGYLHALEEARTEPLEPCPEDCPCKEDA